VKWLNSLRALAARWGNRTGNGGTNPHGIAPRTSGLRWSEVDIDTSHAALMADALECAESHADYLYRRFAAHALCAWQQPVCDGLWDLPLPSDFPGTDGDDGTTHSEDDDTTEDEGRCDVRDCGCAGDVHWPIGGRYTVLLCGRHALGMVA
jgi:hypothetical protein